MSIMMEHAGPNLLFLFSLGKMRMLLSKLAETNSRPVGE